MSTQNKLSLGDDAELAVGATGAVMAVDQIMKGLDSKEHQTSHFVKASIGAAVALGAFELLRRDEPKSGARPRSSSPHSKHHDRHIFEEIIGAYSVGKELMGDKRHHLAHIVGEAIGAVGLLQEVRARDEEEKKTQAEERKRHEEEKRKSCEVVKKIMVR